MPARSTLRPTTPRWRPPGPPASRSSTSSSRRLGRAQTDAETAYRAIFAGIAEGLTFLSMHFNQPGDFETINPEDAHIRTEEYALFRTGRIAEWIDELGIELIGMRPLRDALRAA